MKNLTKNPAISQRKSRNLDCMNFFSSNLRWFRKQNGLTKKLLSEEIGVPVASIDAYERNRELPVPQVLITMADYFGIRVDELIRSPRQEEICNG